MSKISGPLKPQAWIDQHGEVHEELVPVMVWAKRKNAFEKGWLAMAQDALMYLAEEVRSVEDYRVLMALMAKLDFENLIQVPQVELAVKLKMKRPNINRSMKRLVELGVILEGPKIGRSKTYRLNPNIGWKGSAKNHRQAVSERANAAGLRVIKGGVPDRDPNTVDWVGESE